MSPVPASGATATSEHERRLQQFVDSDDANGMEDVAFLQHAGQISPLEGPDANQFDDSDEDSDNSTSSDESGEKITIEGIQNLDWDARYTWRGDDDIEIATLYVILIHPVTFYDMFFHTTPRVIFMYSELLPYLVPNLVPY